MLKKTTDWYRIVNEEEVLSPSLLVYPERIGNNIDQMLRIAGGPERLRPHIKTHKMREIVAMQLERGINKFKCATIAEAELLGSMGAKDVLLAMQTVGPNLERFARLCASFLQTQFATLVDAIPTATNLARLGQKHEIVIPVWLDLNNGMNRSGIAPDASALQVLKYVEACPELVLMGLHLYDGHIRNPNFTERKQRVDEAFEAVQKLQMQAEKAGIAIKAILAGGSPTFPVHALRDTTELGPGTTLLWDARYATLFPDMPFEPAAVLFSRIISKPSDKILCLDLGHKAVAPEMPLPRVQFLNLPNSKQISQSEEHLVVHCEEAEDYQIGDVIYAIPQHICPTVSKYREVGVVLDGSVTTYWTVAARNRKLTI